MIQTVAIIVTLGLTVFTVLMALNTRSVKWTIASGVIAAIFAITVFAKLSSCNNCLY